MHKFDKATIAPLLIFVSVSVILGTLFTIQYYLPIGAINQAEDLPKILRTIDKNYIVNDQFINSSSEHFDIRYYYVLIMAELVSFFGLKTAFLFVCLIVNSSTVFLTGWFAYKLFNKNTLAGLVGCVLTYETIFTVAGGYSLLTSQVVANSVSMIFLFLAFYKLIIEKKLITSSFLLGVGGVIQPLNSIAAFSLCWIGSIFIDIFGSSSKSEAIKNKIRKYVYSVVAFSIPMAFIIVPYIINSSGKIPDELFVNIYGYFRIPHHSMPSYFLRDSIGEILLFIVMIFFILKVSPPILFKRDFKIFILNLFAMSVAFGFCNYIFVEIIPTRLFTILVPIMKLSPIIAWFGTIVIAGYISLPAKKIFHFMPLLLIVYYLDFSQHILILALMYIVNSLFHFSSNFEKKYETSINLLNIFLLILFVLSYQFNFKNYKISKSFDLQNSVNVITNKISSANDDLYSYIEDNTNENAIFIVPHDMQEFRLRTRRAPVALFKTYPPNDDGLKEWYTRMNDVYTCYNSKVHGINASNYGGKLFYMNYLNVDDDCLKYLSHKYGANFAVLYNETVTSAAVLFKNDRYKLVKTF